MAKNLNTTVTALYMVIAAAMLLPHVTLVAEAASCNAASLSSCIDALTSGAPPSSSCCTGLKNIGTPCLCTIKNDPAYAPYISSPNAKRVLSACKVSNPHC